MEIGIVTSSTRIGGDTAPSNDLLITIVIHSATERLAPGDTVELRNLSKGKD